MLAVSVAGSGKTLAYLLPALASLSNRSRDGTKNSASPDVVVLVPTRELAEQVGWGRGGEWRLEQVGWGWGREWRVEAQQALGQGEDRLDRLSRHRHATHETMTMKNDDLDKCWPLDLANTRALTRSARCWPTPSCCCAARTSRRWRCAAACRWRRR